MKLLNFFGFVFKNMVQTSNVARNIQENLNYDTIKLHQNTLKG